MDWAVDNNNKGEIKGYRGELSDLNQSKEIIHKKLRAESIEWKL